MCVYVVVVGGAIVVVRGCVGKVLREADGTDGKDAACGVRPMSR